MSVPAASPRTKPKACNYALAAARGDLVTIYDAEDRPEPLQLRRAAAALARLGPETQAIVFSFADQITPIPGVRPADPAATQPAAETGAPDAEPPAAPPATGLPPAIWTASRSVFSFGAK